MKKHGLTKTVEWHTWSDMRGRCKNPRNADFHLYGGRGISICERWDDFAKFLADVGPRPSPIHSIDRYPNNDGNYEPGNVRWATPKEQAQNRRNNKTPTCKRGHPWTPETEMKNGPWRTCRICRGLRDARAANQ